MSQQIRFESVLNPDKYGYAFESSGTTELWDICYRTRNILSYHSFYFETLGDGRTQHTPLMPVASLELHLDWMLSLANHLSAHPEDYGYELRGFFGYSMPNVETAQFLASIKEPKETDPAVYYSINELKVSKSENKRHDKRWFKLPSDPFKLYYELDRYVSLWNQGQDARTLTPIEWFGLYFSLADGLNKCVSFHASDSLQKWTNEETFKTARVLRELIFALDSTQRARHNVESITGNHLRAKAAIQTATQVAA